jgi:hypothetical protein
VLLHISLPSAQRGQAASAGARNAATALARMDCSACAHGTSDEGLINCSATGCWAPGKRRQLVQLGPILGNRTYQSGRVAALQPSRARALHDRTLQNSMFAVHQVLPFRFFGPLAGPPSRPQTAVSPFRGMRGCSPVRGRSGKGKRGQFPVCTICTWHEIAKFDCLS